MCACAILCMRITQQSTRYVSIMASCCAGTDKHGHLLIMFTYRNVQLDKLFSDYTQEELGQMVAQKMEAWRWLKQQMSRAAGRRRCKHVFIIDFQGATLGKLLRGNSARTFRYGLDVVQDQFPNVLFKMYIYNASFVFRGAWRMVKPWLNPDIPAKVNILGNSTVCKQRMMEVDGFTLADLPVEIGGKHKGKRCYEVLQDAIAANGGVPDCGETASAHRRSSSVLAHAAIGGGPLPPALGAQPPTAVDAAGAAGGNSCSPYPFFPQPLGTLL